MAICCGCVVAAGILVADVRAVPASAVPDRGYPTLVQTQPRNQADEAAVRFAVEESRWIDDIVAHMFDLDLFDAVYANDPVVRLSDGYRLVVDEHKGLHPGLTMGYGFLDYKRAYFGTRRDGTLKLEASMARAAAEGRPLRADEERAAKTGRIGPFARPRLIRPEERQRFGFDQVVIDGDRAEVVVDLGYRLDRQFLRRYGDTWKVVGLRVLRVTG
jgi:hypothetical protein